MNQVLTDVFTPIQGPSPVQITVKRWQAKTLELGQPILSIFLYFFPSKLPFEGLIRLKIAESSMFTSNFYHPLDKLHPVDTSLPITFPLNPWGIPGGSQVPGLLGHLVHLTLELDAQLIHQLRAEKLARPRVLCILDMNISVTFCNYVQSISIWYMCIINIQSIYAYIISIWYMCIMNAITIHNL